MIDCLCERRFGQPMRRDGRHRFEAARHLVLALRATLDDAQSELDGRLDRLVVADFEMQAGHVLDGAPIASVEALFVEHQQAAGNRPLLALGQHQHQVLGHAAPDLLEEGLVQVGRGLVCGIGGRVAAPEEGPVRRPDLAPW